MANEIRLVRDLMTVGVPTCSSETPIADIACLLLERDLEAVVVLNTEGHAVGIVSREDLARAYTRDDRHTLTADVVMTEHVPQVPPDIPLTAAVQIMLDQHLRIAFMMHRAEGIQYPAAMLSFTHLLRHLAAADDAGDLQDLGIKANREPPLAAFIRRRDDARRRTENPPRTEK